MAKGRSNPSKAKAKEVASPPFHPKYEDMIRDAIVTLKERRGSSRQAIKKYILTTYKLPDIGITSSRIRLAINKGVDKGIFSFPNGPSGTIKLVQKKEVKTVKPKTEKKTATKRTSTKVVISTPAKKAPAKPKKTLTATKKTRASTAKTASGKRTGTRKKAASS